jgi:hypothetical protein
VQRSAIICCIESGPLEARTVRLARSIRRFGGALSQVPILAVQPRSGPPLASSTRRALYKLSVELIEHITNKEFAWQHYTNKVFALATAEETVKAKQYIWLDSDILVLAEPMALWLGPDEDFAACAPDTGTLGSTGPTDSRDATWRRACEGLGLALDSLPWVTTSNEGASIRFYMNSGVFAYRGGAGFAQAYLEDCLRYLRARLSKSHWEVHFMDQVVLGLTVHRLGLRWRILPHSCNYACYSKFLSIKQLDRVEAQEFAAAQIIHCHIMMEPKHWSVFCDLLQQANHPLRAELVRFGSLDDPSGACAKVIRGWLGVARGIRRRFYYRACGFRR